MTYPRIRIACALSLALFIGSGFSAEPAVPKIDLPLPWKQGEVLRYESERVSTETGPGKREKSISTSKVAIKTLEAGPGGFVQHWSWSESKEQVLEGDTSMAAAMAEATAELEKIPVVVEMNAEGNYSRVRNLAEIGPRLVTVMRPMLVKTVEKEVQKHSASVGTAERKQAEEKAMAGVDAFLQRFTEPKVLENLLTKEIQNVLAFTGAELENDQAYELETELANPTGGASFPAKLSFGLYVDKEDEQDIWLEWTLKIDPVKGATAVLDTAERLYGRKLSEADRKDLPNQVSIVDKGFMLFERSTGVPELYQNERTTKFGETANYERNRMRLLDRRHDHVWLEQNPQETEPDMSAEERDAQLCADDGADGLAAIAACSRVLERKDLDVKKRASWLAQRGWHRDGHGQPTEAVADFDKAIELAPDQGDYYLWRSTAHRKKGDYPAALADADRAIAMDPKWAYARMIKAFAHERMKEWPKAVAAYDQGISLAPQDANYYDGRCWAKAMTGDYGGGKADCDRTLEIDPGEWNAYNSRGYIHYRTGDYASAVADNDKAIEKAPNEATSWYVRGLAKRALGDAKGADADIAKALQLDAGVVEQYAGYEKK